MKYLTSAILTTLLSLVSAAPINSTNTQPQAAPQVTSLPAAGSGFLLPSVTSQYQVWTGAVNYNINHGKIFKNGQSSDITTLLTFNVPAFAAPQYCEFHFFLDNSATVSGSGLFDVFSSSAPATQSTTTWPQGNLRDNYGGRLQAVVGAEATFQDGYGNDAEVFECPPAGMWGG